MAQIGLIVLEEDVSKVYCQLIQEGHKIIVRGLTGKGKNNDTRFEPGERAFTPWFLAMSPSVLL
jgi:hypothetical protein